MHGAILDYEDLPRMYYRSHEIIKLKISMYLLVTLLQMKEMASYQKNNI